PAKPLEVTRVEEHALLAGRIDLDVEAAGVDPGRGERLPRGADQADEQLRVGSRGLAVDHQPDAARVGDGPLEELAAPRRHDGAGDREDLLAVDRLLAASRTEGRFARRSAVTRVSSHGRPRLPPPGRD